MSKQYLIKRGAVISTGMLIALAAFSAPHPTHAATTCSFTTDLTVGTVSEQVRCLQQYLNGSGFAVSTSGVGSAGQETTQFQAKTKAAVTAWQAAHGIVPATGTWGPKSRAAYSALLGGTTTTTYPTTPTQTSGSQASAQVSLQSAMTEYAQAESSVGTKTSGWANLTSARKKIFEAVNAYINGNYSLIPALSNEATTLARNAVSVSNSSSSSNSGSSSSSNSDKSDAKEAINDAKDDLSDAYDEVDDAYDDGKDTSDAEDDLDDAKDLISDAEDSYDDGDYDDALDLIDEAQDKIDDALDEIDSSSHSSNSGDKEDAKEAISDAKDDLDDAYDEVDDSNASNSDKNKAEDYLDDAQDKIDDAEDAYDDEDYDEALDLIDDAQDLIDKALDEI